jgi:hypothetical protein
MAVGHESSIRRTAAAAMTAAMISFALRDTLFEKCWATVINDSGVAESTKKMSEHGYYDGIKEFRSVFDERTANELLQLNESEGPKTSLQWRVLKLHDDVQSKVTDKGIETSTRLVYVFGLFSRDAVAKHDSPAGQTTAANKHANCKKQACNRCGKDICFHKEDGKWRLYEPSTGERHYDPKS